MTPVEDFPVVRQSRTLVHPVRPYHSFCTRFQGMAVGKQRQRIIYLQRMVPHIAVGEMTVKRILRTREIDIVAAARIALSRRPVVVELIRQRQEMERVVGESVLIRQRRSEAPAVLMRENTAVIAPLRLIVNRPHRQRLVRHGGVIRMTVTSRKGEQVQRVRFPA